MPEFLLMSKWHKDNVYSQWRASKKESVDCLKVKERQKINTPHTSLSTEKSRCRANISSTVASCSLPSLIWRNATYVCKNSFSPTITAPVQVYSFCYWNQLCTVSARVTQVHWKLLTYWPTLSLGFFSSSVRANWGQLAKTPGWSGPPWEPGSSLSLTKCH